MERDSRDLATLKRGDILRHKHMGDSYVVDHVFGSHVTAVRTMEISNPREWVLWTDQLTPLVASGPLLPEATRTAVELATGSLMECYFRTPGADQWTHSKLEATAAGFAEEQQVNVKLVVAMFGRMLLGRCPSKAKGSGLPKAGNYVWPPLSRSDAFTVQMTREQSALIAKLIRQALKTSGPWTAAEVAEGLMLAGCAEDTATSENDGAVNGWCL